MKSVRGKGVCWCGPAKINFGICSIVSASLWFAFVLGCFCFVFSSQSFRGSSYAKQCCRTNTGRVTVAKIHQTLHILPHEACFLVEICAIPRCVQIFPGCLPLWFDIRYRWIRSTAWSPPKWCHWAWSNFVARWLNHTFSFNSRVIKWTERLSVSYWGKDWNSPLVILVTYSSLGFLCIRSKDQCFGADLWLFRPCF